ncbi:U2 snRNP complex subunit [Dimargaris xerosporica]|nr:U2 snRNP complex subunit [Dimargaris xerosporica]
MRLTADLIQQSPTFINTLKDRELDLRGNKIGAIENLGAAKDLNDTLDFSDNDLRQLDNFPRLKRLRSLLVSNNRIRILDPGLAQSMPHLEALVLTNNELSRLVDLEPLTALSYLEHLSLVDNPVTKQRHYRAWLIWRLPSVRILDFQRIKDKERQLARSLFETTDGEPTSLAKSILEEGSKTFEPGENIRMADTSAVAHGDVSQASVPSLAAKAQEQDELRARIAQSANELAGVQRLERLMDGGHIPGGLAHQDRSKPTHSDQAMGEE